MSLARSLRESAEVTMTCNHTNRYARCIPRYGDLAWCYKCDAFKPVKIVEPIPNITIPDTSYSKSVGITVYTNSIYLNKRSPHGRKGS